MIAQVREFVDEVHQLFAQMSILLESEVVAQMVAVGDTFCSYRFEIDVATVYGLVHVFRADERLWTDFCDAVRAHRTWTHRIILMEHVYSISKLTGKLLLLENSSIGRATDGRLQMAEHLNAIDGEIAYCHELADRRDLAKRVNDQIEFPLIDGLSMRGLTYLLGERGELFESLRIFVRGERRSACISDSSKSAKN
jgi:hypothetical protein